MHPRDEEEDDASRDERGDKKGPEPSNPVCRPSPEHHGGHQGQGRRAGEETDLEDAALEARREKEDYQQVRETDRDPLRDEAEHPLSGAQVLSGTKRAP